MNQEVKWEEKKTWKRQEEKEVKRSFTHDISMTFPNSSTQDFTSELQIKQAFSGESSR